VNKFQIAYVEFMFTSSGLIVVCKINVMCNCRIFWVVVFEVPQMIDKSSLDSFAKLTDLWLDKNPSLILASLSLGIFVAKTESHPRLCPWLLRNFSLLSLSLMCNAGNKTLLGSTKLGKLTFFSSRVRLFLAGYFFRL
jgi:hypothetical protein